MLKVDLLSRDNFKGGPEEALPMSSPRHNRCLERLFHSFHSGKFLTFNFLLMHSQIEFTFVQITIKQINAVLQLITVFILSHSSKCCKVAVLHFVYIGTIDYAMRGHRPHAMFRKFRCTRFEVLLFYSNQLRSSRL